jgi:hypothetical protein
MHDPLYHHRNCATKQGYATRREAKAAAKITTRKCGIPLYAYECPCCQWWHVTKLPPKAQRVAREAALRERGGAM